MTSQLLLDRYNTPTASSLLSCPLDLTETQHKCPLCDKPLYGHAPYTRACLDHGRIAEYLCGQKIDKKLCNGKLIVWGLGDKGRLHTDKQPMEGYRCLKCRNYGVSPK